MNPTEANGAVGQQYNLKWTNHTYNLLQMFSEQLLKECLVDVTISCEGQFIKAHKMVLSACSPYFQELFRIHAADHPVIIMNGVPFTTVRQMIDFMYQGEIKVGDADLDQLLTIAENLQIKGLCKIRREKNVSETNTFTSDLLNLQNTTAQINKNTTQPTPTTPKGRKRRKQSHSPVNTNSHGSVTENPVNGDSVHQTTEVPAKIPNLDTLKDEVDKSIQKLDPKLAKLDTTKQSLNNSNEDKTTDKPSPKIPRPPNAFMIFANEWRKKLAVEHLGESNKEISVRLGNMWKALPATTKEWYYSAARKADEDHKVKYPGYYYSPKEARLRKEMRGNNSRTVSATATKTIDTTTLVKTVMPVNKNDNSSIEEVPANEIKEEPEDFSIFDDDENDSNSSGELLSNTPPAPKD